MNHFGHEIVAPATNRELGIAADHRLDSRNRSKAFFSARVVRGEYDSTLGTVPLYQALRSVDVNDAAVLDDGYPIAQTFGLLHEMGGQKNRFAALANATHQIPNRAPRLRIKPCR